MSDNRDLEELTEIYEEILKSLDDDQLWAISVRDRVIDSARFFRGNFRTEPDYEHIIERELLNELKLPHVKSMLRRLED